MSQNNKLITEYPFREALAIYLGIWKRLFLAAIKSLVAIGIIVVVVQLFGSLIVGAGLRLLSSTVSNAISFLVDHRILVVGGIFLLAAIFVVLRTVRANNPTKW